MLRDLPVSTPAPLDTIFEYAPATDESTASDRWKRAILVGGVVFTLLKAIEWTRLTIHAVSSTGFPSHVIAWTVLNSAAWIAMFAACLAMWRGWTSTKFLRIALVVTCVGTQLHEAIELPHMVFPIRPGDGVRTAAFLVSASCDLILNVYWPIVMIVCLGRARVTQRRLLVLAAIFGALLTLCEATGVVHHWLSYHAWPGNAPGDWRFAWLEQICDEVSAVVTLIVFLLAIARALPPIVATCIAVIVALSPMCVQFLGIVQVSRGADVPLGLWYQLQNNLTYSFIVYFVLWMLVRQRHTHVVARI